MGGEWYPLPTLRVTPIVQHFHPVPTHPLATHSDRDVATKMSLGHGCDGRGSLLLNALKELRLLHTVFDLCPMCSAPLFGLSGLTWAERDASKG
jgi:hypothetical protein